MVAFTSNEENPVNFQTAELIDRVIADWQIIADLAFSDLVIWCPRTQRPSGETIGLVAVAQARPFTAQTTLHRDVVGSSPRVGLKPLVQQAWMTGKPVSPDDVPNPVSSLGVTVWPVKDGDTTVGVITVHRNLTSQRTPSRLEMVYRQCAEDLLLMTSQGLWPDPQTHQTSSLHGNPSVGDGLIRLDAHGLVTFASPNAVSAYRKLGMTDSLEGRQLSRVTLDQLDPRRTVDESLSQVLFGRASARTSIDVRTVNLILRSIPLLGNDGRYSAIVLLRDVTEIRRRDRQLIGKDATIREIHHRVKNNLQTVGSLLRMQSRRMTSTEAQRGLEQAMKRVETIALVHETLSQTITPDVDMDDLLNRQFKLAVEIASDTRQITAVIKGKFGSLPGELATPLALVINELATNAVEHGTGPHGGVVLMQAIRKKSKGSENLEVSISDEGSDGSAETRPSQKASGGLGLQIVRTLVTSDLNGSIEWLPEPNKDGGVGTIVKLSIPLDLS